jgi:hypothetical protein
MQALALVLGVIAAAALDRRLGWGTIASVGLALYCHRLYRRPLPAVPSPAPFPPADEEDLRPGWAARWGARCTAELNCEHCSGRALERVASIRPSGKPGD